MTIVYGDHAVKALLSSPHHETATLYVESAKHKIYQALVQKAKQQKVAVTVLKQLPAQFKAYRHQGIAATFQFQYASLATIDVSQQARVLVLDRIQDPHNFGACMRSAAAFGIDVVIIPQRGQAPLSETVHQVSCGGSLVVPLVQVSNLSQAVSELKDRGVWFIATSERADAGLKDIPLDRSLGIVMGSEGEGVRQKLLEACDYQVKIATTERLSTLNVSVATGVLLHSIFQG
ncbi:23S rRNA (guanosine(2251)-2'-O)-methyltransferase RlmB [Candidatus Synchoanobacter obligatus]|uniref:23S rRNA (Guanosine(2251)-2'-O)-methyltransferase RlmB n=1 Tax=Candidatus Synchoanobacter obligatus TaxID=2919597 RepID=A0ABT1L429_9GAMM|nr:23S rRNA (guanosine(2251)-2'-O)-methyltransferase RlmB [Candidatus Synchoanobacter obligatus]MCP8351944.1 23S rRNA (guanosine(2251)-2'-O)-methyltransferase RlmB [Candidatus Synchoanobacter obligatus]